MVQIIGREPTAIEQLFSGLSKGVERGTDFAKMGYQAKQQKELLQQEFAGKKTLAEEEHKRKQDIATQFKQKFEEQGLDPQIAELLGAEMAGAVSGGSTKSAINALRESRGQPTIDAINDILQGSDNPDMGSMNNLSQNAENAVPQQNVEVPTEKPSRNFNNDIREKQNKIKQLTPLITKGTPEQTKKASEAINLLQKQIDDLRKEEEFGLKEQNRKRREFESERDYHTSFSKPIELKASSLRESVPRKESALDSARNAVETGDVSYFSKDKLADVTGQDIFRTAKGAQLITAGKENLLSNMSKVSARAQNQWFEQRLNSMFPKIGQSKEANLTVQEMLEAELALDKLYLNTYDRLSTEDEDRFGYTRKDIDKRVNDEIKSQQKEIFQRTSYKMKELEEQEKGETKLKNEVGKNVVKGTPLTLQMAKLYKDKFGDNALSVAKKNGYTIPTIEEFQKYQMGFQEYREGLGE